MDEKQKLLEAKTLLRERDEHIAVSTKGGDFVTIKGADITDFKVHKNGAIIAVTEQDEYYIIPSYTDAEEAMESMPFADLLQQISDDSSVNIHQIGDVDYKAKRITFIDGDQKTVDDKYWDKFIIRYEARILH